MSQIQSEKSATLIWTKSNLQFHQNQCPTRDDFLADLVSQFVVKRKELGFSQAEVDQKMGNADRVVSKWECGMQTPSSFNLFCWAQVLGAELRLGVKIEGLE